MTDRSPRHLHTDSFQAVPLFDSPLPDAGVAVFRGPNGSGKSSLLDAAEELGRGPTGKRLAPSDDASRGVIEGLGVRITLGRRNNRSGELAAGITYLDSRADPARIADPGITDPAAADEHRIRALLALTGTTTAPADFAHAATDVDRFRELVGDLDATPGDPVIMAAAVKKRLAAAARKEEEEARRLEGEIRAALAIHDPGDGPCDEEKLAAAFRAAERRLAGAEALQQSAQEQAEARAEAEALLECAERPDVEALEKAAAAAAKAERDAQAVLDDARREQAEARAEAERAKAALETGRRLAAQVQAAEAALAAAPDVKRADEELAAAQKAAAEAAAAVTRGGEIRARQKAVATAAEKRDRRVVHEETAEALRADAKAVDRVLGELVALSGIAGLSVEDGRLYTQHRRGDRTLLGELSPGERLRITVPAAIKAVGPGGMFSLAQEAWEALDPANRDYVHAEATEAGVLVLTAEADDGPLRLELHKPAGAS